MCGVIVELTVSAVGGSTNCTVRPAREPVQHIAVHRTLWGGNTVQKTSAEFRKIQYARWVSTQIDVEITFSMNIDKKIYALYFNLSNIEWPLSVYGNERVVAIYDII